MVKHNNVIPNVHLRKHWQRNVKVWLNQAGRKSRRLTARRAKAQASGVRPVDRVRPIVHCQTIRYNHRTRLGKGFTLQEIRACGLSLPFARSVGIAIDHRRKNRTQEGFELNKARLTAYIQKLVLFPRTEKKYVSKAKKGLLNDTPKEQQTANASAVVNSLPPLIRRVRSVSKADLEKLKKDRVYNTLRIEWSNQRNEGKRKQKELKAAEKS